MKKFGTPRLPPPSVPTEVLEKRLRQRVLLLLLITAVLAYFNEGLRHVVFKQPIAVVLFMLCMYAGTCVMTIFLLYCTEKRMNSPRSFLGPIGAWLAYSIVVTTIFSLLGHYSVSSALDYCVIPISLGFIIPFMLMVNTLARLGRARRPKGYFS